jgi:hypothetical protein
MASMPIQISVLAPSRSSPSPRRKARSLPPRSVEIAQQLSKRDAEPPRQTNKHSNTGVPLAALNAADVGQGEAADVGYLLLGETAFGADSEDVSAEAVEGIAGHGGIVVAWGRSALELISLATG